MSLGSWKFKSSRSHHKMDHGALAERLRGGLQNLLDQFDSGTCLHFSYFYARVLELVDKRDLKSLAQKACGFDSRSAHQAEEMRFSEG